MVFPFDEDLYLKALADNQIMWRKHALTKMAERGILRHEVLDVLNKKDIVRIYQDDKPFPSVLLLGFSDERPLHVVMSFDEKTSTVFIITAYQPDLFIFESDFKTKKK